MNRPEPPGLKSTQKIAAETVEDLDLSEMAAVADDFEEIAHIVRDMILVELNKLVSTPLKKSDPQLN